jgi:hypothetical protein
VALLKISSKAGTTSLRAREPSPIRVGAVRKQRQDALAAKLGEPVEIGGLVVERRLVDLEVAGVHDRPGRRVDRERHGVGDAVGHAEELDAEWPDRDGLPRRHRDQPVADVDTVLLELWLDERGVISWRRSGPSSGRSRERPRYDLVRASLAGDAPAVRIECHRSGMTRSTPNSSGSGNMTPHPRAGQCPADDSIVFIPNCRVDRDDINNGASRPASVQQRRDLTVSRRVAATRIWATTAAARARR